MLTNMSTKNHWQYHKGRRWTCTSIREAVFIRPAQLLKQQWIDNYPRFPNTNTSSLHLPRRKQTNSTWKHTSFRWPIPPKSPVSTAWSQTFPWLNSQFMMVEISIFDIEPKLSWLKSRGFWNCLQNHAMAAMANGQATFKSLARCLRCALDAFLQLDLQRHALQPAVPRETCKQRGTKELWDGC